MKTTANLTGMTNVPHMKMKLATPGHPRCALPHLNLSRKARGTRSRYAHATLRNRQGGAVAVMVGISMVALIGFLALVIDLGHLYVAKTGLQNAADAAALAGAKELDGSLTGINSAVSRAQLVAQHNTFFDSTGQVAVTLDSSNIYFCVSPNCASWQSVAAAQASPSNLYFIKVDTASRNLMTWFAPIWGFSQTSTSGMAVAGRYPPGAIAPLFVPAVRRNADQANQPSADTTAPYCNGVIYDPLGKNSIGKKLQNNTCPYDAVNGSFPYRVPDNTGNWGFLTPQDLHKTFPDFAGVKDSCTHLDPDKASPTYNTCVPESRGSFYVVTPTPNNSGGTPWASGTSWTGNFGFMLKATDVKTLNELAAALCRGGTALSYPVPGCGVVHTGNVSGPKIADNLNTRFDLQGNQTQLPHSACPSDTNIYDAGSGNWLTNGPNGYYVKYSAGSPLVQPTNYPPGKANRRLINVYVADNVILPGENLPGSQDDTCWADQLTGGKNDAHLVGCAQFFVWSKAANDGKLYAEFVKKLDQSQCNSSIGTETEIRLYQ